MASIEAYGPAFSASETISPAPRPISPNERGAEAEDGAIEYEDEYPVYQGLLQDLPASAPYELGDYELRHMPPGNQDSGWQKCLDSVEKHDRELCQAYREQIDTLLVFAGLFSAVVTAFAVESYQWLQDDPLDTSGELLRDVRLSDAAVVRINSFWFLSLTLSLAAALVGILCKQWLREFERNVGQSPETALGVRYIRFQGLEYWKVGSIVASVPIILQLALACFIVGVIELLWRLHVIVACCVSVVAGLTFAFYLATTLLPVIQYAYICLRCYFKPLRTRDYSFARAFMEPQCAFKSAQAWLAFKVAQPVINRLLKAYGYRFAAHHPPAILDPILRHPDSWVSFDLNWVKCRENIHVGPRCAFESLTWIASHLGEMHLSSSIWHCVWARWLKNRDDSDELPVTTKDIETVARSYPRILARGNDITPLARPQALIFHCSLRTDLPIDTAIELLLRVAAVSGACSQWTRDALQATRVVYRNHVVQLSNDIAIELFHLAELQTQEIVSGLHEPRANSATPYDGALAFREIVDILHRGTHLRDRFMSAMSGLILQWLRSRPSRPIVKVAIAIFEDIIGYLESQGYRGMRLNGLRHYRGVVFIAKLAGAVAEIWPEFARTGYETRPDANAVLWELLAIFSEGFPELTRYRSAPRTEGHLEAVNSADGERSSPLGRGAHVGTLATDTHAAPSPPLVNASDGR